MAKTEDGHTIVEGDGTAVPVQIAPGGAGSPARPTKGTQLVWGGGDASSPWGHVQALIEAAGGSVQYTYFHSSVLAQLAKGKKPKPPPQKPTSEQKKQEDDSQKDQHDKNTSFEAEAHPADLRSDQPLFSAGHDFEYDNQGKKDARLWAHPAAPAAGKVPLLVFLHGIAPNLTGMDCDFPQLQDDFDAHLFGCHLGRVAQALIDGGKVRPLAVVAPTAHDNKSSTHLWRVFDLSKLVQRVAEEIQ